MYSLIDLFSGAGGLSLGFSLTKKFQLLAGIDNNFWALKTLYANHPEASDKFIQPQDIYELTGEILLQKLNLNHLDMLIGGPPCQGFSIAGKRIPQDDRNELVWEFFRFVSELLPKAFVMENVPGLLLAKHINGETLIDVLQKRYAELGYACSLWHLNAVDYGVPQLRKRAFLVGFFGETRIAPPTPTSVRNRDLFNQNPTIITSGYALNDLPEPNFSEPQSYLGNPINDYQNYLRDGSKALYNHVPAVHKPEMIERLKSQLPGTRLYPNWNHSWYRLDPDKPSPTVKENHRAPFVHPTEPRVTTPRECARLQSFPDRYVFYGTKTSQLMQIGNAVPPLLAKAIAQKMVSVLDEATVARY